MPERHPSTRVLYVENNTDGTIGGSHHCLLQLVANLDRARFEPTVVFYDDHVLVDRFRAVADTVVEPKDQPVLWGTSGPLRHPAAVLRRAVNLGRVSGKVARQVRLLRSRGIRLLHLNNSITRQHDWMVAARLAGVPCIVHERGLPRYTAVDRAFGRRLDLIIPMSQWIARAMVDQGVSDANIRVMYDGIDPDRMAAGASAAQVRAAWNVAADQPVFGMVGNVREWKGQETVVRALSTVVRAHPTAVCFFVGATSPQDHDYKARLDALIAEAGLTTNVRFTGYQSDVPGFVDLMQFVIHASIQPEPFGMVVLEAMARGKPVIGSRAGGVVEMVVDGETGLTFAPGDAGELATMIGRLLADEAACRRMGERGLARVRSHFSLQRYVDQVQDAYDAVLQRRPVGGTACAA